MRCRGISFLIYFSFLVSVGKVHKPIISHKYRAVVQLGLKLNTKIGLDNHPPTHHNKLF